jgi:calcineurin B family protein 1
MELIYAFFALVPFVNQHFVFLISVAFRMYDLDGDDKISKEELLAVLTMMVGANICEEQLISIAERTIMEADTDKDNLISFDEFKKVLERTDVEQKMSIRFLS